MSHNSFEIAQHFKQSISGFHSFRSVFLFLVYRFELHVQADSNRINIAHAAFMCSAVKPFGASIC